MLAHARSAATPAGTRTTLAACALALLLPTASAAASPPSAAPTPPPAAPSPPPGPRRNIAGPGDYPLREKLVKLLGHDPDLMKEKFVVVMVNGGAVFSGEISNCALKKRALTTAAVVRGVINVTDEITVTRGLAPDAELAKTITGTLGDASESLGLQDLKVKVEDGVLTLDGTVADLAARDKAEDLAGAVLGVTRISNHLMPRNAPSGTDDATLQSGLLKYMSDFHQFAYPGDFTVKVEGGVAILRGRVSLFMGRQQAGMVASLVRGLTRVDNQIKVDPSYTEGPRPHVEAGS